MWDRGPIRSGQVELRASGICRERWVDGVFAPTGDSSSALRFVPLPPPEDEEVFAIAVRIAGRVLPLLCEDADDATEDRPDPAWAAAVAEATTPALASPRSPSLPWAKRRTAFVDGFSLHADVAVAEGYRAGLERLLRYGARPPFAHQRLSLTAAGRVSYRLRWPAHTGQTHIVLEPVAFLRRLAMLVPPPRQNLIRFHGLLAPNARHRPALVAMAPSSAEQPPRLDATGSADSAAGRLESMVLPADLDSAGPAARGSAYRLPWAALLRRVFAVDILVCPRCAGPMRLIAAVTDPDSGRARTLSPRPAHRHPGRRTRTRAAPGRPLPRPLLLTRSPGHQAGYLRPLGLLASAARLLLAIGISAHTSQPNPPPPTSAQPPSLFPGYFATLPRGGLFVLHVSSARSARTM